MTGDLISREALIDEINLDIGFERECDIPMTAVNAFKIAIKRAKRLPAIDAVPVVRCSECVHRGLPACPMCHDESYYDEDDGTEYYTVDKTDDNGFCHIGAKMDKED